MEGIDRNVDKVVFVFKVHAINNFDDVLDDAVGQIKIIALIFFEDIFA